MKICEKLTVKDGWVNGFTHHRNGNHGGPLTTPAVKGLLEHTMVGNLRHTDAMFTRTTWVAPPGAPTVAPTRTKDRITLARGPAPRSCGGQ
jgi:hypothetical protein